MRPGRGRGKVGKATGLFAAPGGSGPRLYDALIGAAAVPLRATWFAT